MGAFATIGSAGALGGRFRGASITAGGVIADTTPGGSNNATPTLSEANGISAPMLMIHCDADPVVPPSRSLLLQQLLNTNGVINQRVLVSSNSIPNPTNWHNLQNDPNINSLILTNTRSWFQARGVLP